jgi:hypothetical protein
MTMHGSSLRTQSAGDHHTLAAEGEGVWEVNVQRSCASNRREVVICLRRPWPAAPRGAAGARAGIRLRP